MPKRRTKIVATLGPSTATPEVMEAMLRAGLDVARLNLSHGTHDAHRAQLELARAAAARTGRWFQFLGTTDRKQ